MTDEQPHDSAYVYSQLKARHTEAVFPTLQHQEKSSKYWIGVSLLLAVVVLGSWGAAYELQINILNRPTVLTGQCPSPAVIQNGGCFIVQTSTDSQGNSHTVLVPAGHIVGGG